MNTLAFPGGSQQTPNIYILHGKIEDILNTLPFMTNYCLLRPKSAENKGGFCFQRVLVCSHIIGLWHEDRHWLSKSVLLHLSACLEVTELPCVELFHRGGLPLCSWGLSAWPCHSVNIMLPNTFPQQEYFFVLGMQDEEGKQKIRSHNTVLFFAELNTANSFRTSSYTIH